MEKAYEETGNTLKTETPDEDEPRIELQYFRGVPFSKHTFNVDLVKEISEFKPDPTDIFVVTYPKCGTTWMQFIVWEIVNQGEPPPSPNQMMFTHFPFLEVTGLDKLSELPKPRLMKTHLPFHLQPHHPSAKYIYVMRNPWDCCVSYFHHMQFEFPDDKKLPFDTFFEHFIQGKVAFGDYFDHLLSWYAHKNDPNILFLTYEDMSADSKETMLTVAKFLGDKYFEILKKDEQVLNNCLKHSEFKYMKDLGMFFPKMLIKDKKNEIPGKEAMKALLEAMGSVDKNNVDLEKFKVASFFRKGKIGDWRNYFTESHTRRFNDYIRSKVNNTDLENMEILRCHDVNELE